MFLSGPTLLLLAATQIQAIDTIYARMVEEATTDRMFLPGNVATLPTHPTIPSPLDHFGVIAGAPGVAHTTAELHAYYYALAAASPRVMIDTIGRSEGGRDILVVAIGDENTIADIERFVVVAISKRGGMHTLSASCRTPVRIDLNYVYR